MLPHCNQAFKFKASELLVQGGLPQLVPRMKDFRYNFDDDSLACQLVLSLDGNFAKQLECLVLIELRRKALCLQYTIHRDYALLA